MNTIETNQTVEQRYNSPDFEVVVVEFEQNILSGGSGGTDDFGYGGDL